MSKSGDYVAKLTALPLTTLDDELRRLCGIYGKKAVLAAAKIVAVEKIGRPKAKDGGLIWPYCLEDARLWLDGDTETPRLTNYRIANEIAASIKGQSVSATHARIERKLKQSRKIWTRIAAYHMSANYPYTAHIRAMRALQEVMPSAHTWALEADSAEMMVASLQSRGVLIRPEMTLAEVQAEQRRIEQPPMTLGMLSQFVARHKTPKD